jgi:uncharacterized DUF497 family protein
LQDIKYNQDGLVFRWSEVKAETNLKKHGIAFEEAATAFRDINAQIFDDEEHSEDEYRFILLGYSVISRLLIVCHCYRSNDEDEVRIISARQATKHERQKYEEKGAKNER